MPGTRNKARIAACERAEAVKEDYLGCLEQMQAIAEEHGLGFKELMRDVLIAWIRDESHKLQKR